VRPSDIAKLPEGRRKAAVQKREHRKASVRAKVEHPFRVIKRQFGLMKVRFRGLAKYTRTLSRCSRCRTCGWRDDS
jgi:IS5 family transposase